METVRLDMPVGKPAWRGLSFFIKNEINRFFVYSFQH